MSIYEIKNNHIVIKLLFIKFSILILDWHVTVFFFLVRLIDIFIPKRKNKIVFCIDYNQMSASIMYYRYLKENFSEKYEILSFTNSKKNNEINYLFTLKNIFKALSAKYVVFTNCNRILEIFKSKKHIYINLWHGMPIKNIGFLSNLNKTKYRYYNFASQNAFFFVTSDIFKQFFMTSFNTSKDRVFITGSSRNDLIGNNDNDEKIKQIFNLDNFSKIVLYMPTWKATKATSVSQILNEFNNIFYLDDYEENDFIKMIEDNNILFIMKPHPLAEFFYKKNPDFIPNSNNFKIIYTDDFYNHEFDCYELFKFIDVMVSDYSSAAIDYMLLNRPVIFLTSLAEDYSQNRGMILEDNYEILMAGSKAKTYKEFKQQFIENLYHDSYKQEREKSLPLIHKYRDFNSCERIYKVMESLK